MKVFWIFLNYEMCVILDMLVSVNGFGVDYICCWFFFWVYEWILKELLFVYNIIREIWIMSRLVLLKGK